MLINTLFNVFTSNGYDVIETEPMLDRYLTYLLSPMSPQREEFYLVVEALDQTEEAHSALLDEGVEKMFETIRNLKQISRAFEKNCTLIICCNEKSISRDLVLKMEEDPYNFKKNVIGYTQGELTGFEQHTKDVRLTNKVLNDIINASQGEDFREYKERRKNFDNHYSLTMKLLMKLPFITYSPQEKSLANLDEDIVKAFTQRQTLMYEKILSVPVDSSDQDIDLVLEELWGSK